MKRNWIASVGTQMLATGDDSRPSQDTVLLCVVLLRLEATLHRV